jgi:hypothetical protein
MVSNVCQRVGLVNGAIGVVVDIIYAPGVAPPELPTMVMVGFGDSYTGPSFFPDDESRRGWVPVHSASVTADQKSRCPKTRTAFPLRLAFAWTAWKAQGQTFHGKVVASFGPKEPEHGITYTTMSRVTKMENVGILDSVSVERFTTKINNHSKMQSRKAEEERLKGLGATTIDRLLALWVAAAAAAAAQGITP